MPAIKKESFGTLSDGQAASIFTLRNTKGNELKVTDYGARVVSFRFRNKDFENKFVFVGHDKVADYEKNDLGIVYVDGTDLLAKKIWNAEETVEGVKFSIKDGDKEVAVIYSISNDNEISIKYEAKGVNDVSTQITFSGDVINNPDFKVFSDEFKGGNFGEWQLIDKPAEVEFVEGMFGFDIGCPIDYYDAGLKNAADIFSKEASILLQIYANQDKLHVEEVEGGFAVKTSGSKSDNDVIKSQTVYVLKNKD